MYAVGIMHIPNPLQMWVCVWDLTIKQAFPITTRVRQMYLSLLSSESAEQNGLVPDVVASVYFENMIARKIYTLLMQILS